MRKNVMLFVFLVFVLIVGCNRNDVPLPEKTTAEDSNLIPATTEKIISTPVPSTKPTPVPTPTLTSTQYFDISYPEFIDIFLAKASEEFEIGSPAGAGYPLGCYETRPVLFLLADEAYKNGDAGDWKSLEVRVIDYGNTQYDSDLAEIAVNIAIRAAQVFDPSLPDDEIHDVFLNGADTAKKKWSDDYNSLQFWYSRNGFEFYLNDYVNQDIGIVNKNTSSSFKIPSYCYSFTISLSANE